MGGAKHVAAQICSIRVILDQVFRLVYKINCKTSAMSYQGRDDDALCGGIGSHRCSLTDR